LFLHVLPRGFVRIRYFGYLANRQRKALLLLCRQLPRATTPDTVPRGTEGTGPGTDFWACPRCGGSMIIVERLTPSQTYVRTPPTPEEWSDLHRDSSNSSCASAYPLGVGPRPGATAPPMQIPDPSHRSDARLQASATLQARPCSFRNEHPPGPRGRQRY
jgi:hypothetical protein